MNIFKELSKRPYICLILLVSIVAATTLKNSFLSIDDQELIVENPKIDLSVNEILSTLMEPLGAHNHDERSVYYRPALPIYYSLNYKIWGMNPVGFHISNLLLHLLTAIITYRIGLLLFNNNVLVSLIAASLFAVHPVHNEALGRVALNDNLFGFFMASSLYLFLRERKIASLIMFIFSLLSKESAVMLVFLFLVVSVRKHGFKKGVRDILPYVVPLGIYLFHRMMVLEGDLGVGEDGLSIWVRSYTMAAALTDYLRLLIIPFPLSPYYGARIYTSLFQPQVAASIGVLVLLSFLVIRLRDKKNLVDLLLLLFITLLPAILKVNAMILGAESGYIAERQLYVPSIFFSLFISAFFIENASEKSRKFVASGFVLLIAMYSFITISSTKLWENDSTLISRFIDENPDAIMTHFYRGNILFYNDRFDEAMRELEAALQASPRIDALLQQEDAASSKNKPIWDSLRGYTPGFARVHLVMGKIYFEKNDIDRSIRKFKTTLVLRPHNGEARYYLGLAYMKKREFEKAEYEFRECLKRQSQ